MRSWHPQGNDIQHSISSFLFFLRSQGTSDWTQGKNKVSKRSRGFTESDITEGKANVIFGIRAICYRRVINVSILQLLSTPHFLPFSFREERAWAAFQGIPGCHKGGTHKTLSYSLVFFLFKTPWLCFYIKAQLLLLRAAAWHLWRAQQRCSWSGSVWSREALLPRKCVASNRVYLEPESLGHTI